MVSLGGQNVDSDMYGYFADVKLIWFSVAFNLCLMDTNHHTEATLYDESLKSAIL